jgi:hypothetical protein
MIAVGEGGGGSAPDPIVMKRKSNVVRALIWGKKAAGWGDFCKTHLHRRGSARGFKCKSDVTP